MRRMSLIGVTVISAAVLAGCADMPARLRRHTYPPNFKYISRSEIRSVMWRLAADVRDLDDLMRQPEPIDDARRARIAEILASMDAAARELATEGRPSNHPLIEDNLEGLRRALDAARVSVESGRPNSYLVGSVSGACLGCHAPDR